MEEFEIKFLEVDVLELEKKLISIGAEKVGEYNYSRVLLDFPDFRLNKNHSWLRLRTNGEETTLAYKENVKDKVKGRDVGVKEIEIIVDNYNKTFELLKHLGFVTKRAEKNTRIRYKKEKVTFDIDLWPRIPPYLEIEADSIKEAKNAALELGFDGEKGLICSAGAVYKHYGYDINDYTVMTPEEFVKK